jgi:energy-coupling factor transporter ATP-binding protein EcfA2
MPSLTGTVTVFFAELLKYQAEKKLGEGALSTLANALVDHAGEGITEKITDFLDHEKQEEKIIAAFEKADRCFAEECNDDLLKQMIVSMPFARLENLEQLALNFTKTLDSKQLIIALENQFARTWKEKITKKQSKQSAKIYHGCLERSLATQSEHIFSMIFSKVEGIGGKADALLVGQDEIKELIQARIQITDNQDAHPRVGSFLDQNPFGLKGKITNIQYYLDRQPFTKTILNELRKGSSISLVGESQTGKSSLLWYLAEVVSEIGKKPISILDMQTIRDEDDFYEALCSILDVSTARGFALSRSLGRHNHVLCLDEIERMTWKGFSKDIRTELRGLADGNDTPLTLLIASRQPLEKLFLDDPKGTSPLANLCTPYDMPFFSKKEAYALAEKYLPKPTNISLNEGEVEQAWEKSKGNPGRLQEELKRCLAQKINKLEGES